MSKLLISVQLKLLVIKGHLHQLLVTSCVNEHEFTSVNSCTVFGMQLEQPQRVCFLSLLVQLSSSSHKCSFQHNLFCQSIQFLFIGLDFFQMQLLNIMYIFKYTNQQMEIFISVHSNIKKRNKTEKHRFSILDCKFEGCLFDYLISY